MSQTENAKIVRVNFEHVLFSCITFGKSKMKYISLLMILSILVGSAHGSSLQDDEKISAQIMSAVHGYFENRGDERTNYQLLSIDRYRSRGSQADYCSQDQ